MHSQMDARRNSSGSSPSETLRQIMKPKPAIPVSKHHFTMTLDVARDLVEDQHNCMFCRSRQHCKEHEGIRNLKSFVREASEYIRDRGCKLGELNAVRTLPADLSFCMSGVCEGSLGVCVRTSHIPAEKWWGPYLGRQIPPSEAHQVLNRNDDYAWEVYDHRRISFYIDGADPSVANWMRFVRCAASQRLANVSVIQYDMQIHFQTMREVRNDEELLVWYAADCYHNVHGIPCGLRSRTLHERRRGSDVRRQQQAVQQQHTTHHHSQHVIVTTATTPVTEYRTAYAVGSTAGTPVAAGTIILQQPPPQQQPQAPPPLHHHHHRSSGQRPVIMLGDAGVVMPVAPATQPQALPPGMPYYVQTPAGIPIGTYTTAAVAGAGPEAGGGMRLAMQPRGLEVKRHINRWECSQCEEVFGQRLNMEKHVCRQGEIAKPYRCMMCYVTFSSGQYLQGHVSNDCIRGSDGPQEKPYGCEYCRKPFTGTTTLMNHIRTHFEDRPKRCDQCGEDFKTHSAMNRHVCKDLSGDNPSGEPLSEEPQPKREEGHSHEGTDTSGSSSSRPDSRLLSPVDHPHHQHHQQQQHQQQIEQSSATGGQSHAAHRPPSGGSGSSGGGGGGGVDRMSPSGGVGGHFASPPSSAGHVPLVPMPSHGSPPVHPMTAAMRQPASASPPYEQQQQQQQQRMTTASSAGASAPASQGHPGRQQDHPGRQQYHPGRQQDHPGRQQDGGSYSPMSGALSPPRRMPARPLADAQQHRHYQHQHQHHQHQHQHQQQEQQQQPQQQQQLQRQHMPSSVGSFGPPHRPPALHSQPSAAAAAAVMAAAVAAAAASSSSDSSPSSSSSSGGSSNGRNVDDDSSPSEAGSKE